MSTKVEIKVIKLEGIQWSTLEGNAEEVVPKAIPLGELLFCFYYCVLICNHLL